LRQGRAELSPRDPVFGLADGRPGGARPVAAKVFSAMTASLLGAPDLACALDLGQLGLAIVDRRLIVVERTGSLSGWLPEAGRGCCDCPLLFGMEAEFAALRENPGAPLNLPSVQAASDGERINISLAWNGETGHFVIVTTPDEGTKQLERLLFRERREMQLLQQQAAAAMDRSRIDATLYRDIVESTNDAVLRLRPDLTIAFVNTRAARLVGGGEETRPGQPIREVLSLPRLGNPWRSDMCARGPASFDQPVRDSAGAAAWLWWDVRWLGDSGGPAEFQAVGRDVTETRRLRAAVEKAHEEAKFAALADERLRIAHDLHDTLIHSVVNLMARLALLRREASDENMKQDLAAAEAEARRGLREAREAVAEIRRPDLPDGPGPTLTEAAQKLRARGVNVILSLDENLNLASPHQSTAIARVAREALRNVELHSGARNVEISAKVDAKAFVLHIADDGIGYDAAIERSGHYGLIGMREQSKLVGGDLNVVSAPGCGAALTLTIPR
jgi:PAS domain S-box-containing protein